MKINYAWAFIMLLLVGCATTPAIDTMNKREAAFEIAYGEMLSTVVLYAQEGRLTSDQGRRISNVLDEVENARTAMRAAKIIKDQKTFDDQMSIALTAIQVAREIIKESENE